MMNCKNQFDEANYICQSTVFHYNPINFWFSFSILAYDDSEEEESETKVGEQRYIKAKVHQSPESSGSRHSSKEPSPIKSKCLVMIE